MMESDVNVRMNLALLPKLLQTLITWITGKALPGQTPFISSTASSQLMTACFWLLFGFIGSIAIQINSLPWLLLFVTWIVTVHGSRKLQVMIGHQCVHDAFSGIAWKDRVVMEILSTVLMIKDYQGYKQEHVEIHHTKKLATLDDPDLKFLLLLGFRPGMTVRDLWLNLLITLVSPRFHLLFLYFRIKANFFSCPLYRKLMSLIFHTTILFFVAANHMWSLYLVGWLFPITVLYHMSALLQFVCEHKWLKIKSNEETGKIHLARLTSGRFCGSPVPTNGSYIAWGLWVLKMLYHCFCRIFVLVGELCVHDWHHRHPLSKGWPNAFYARQHDIDAGCPGWPEPYSEIWGLHNAITAVFKLWSSLPAISLEPSNLTSEEIQNQLFKM